MCGLCRCLTGGIFSGHFSIVTGTTESGEEKCPVVGSLSGVFLVHNSAMCKVGMLITDSGTWHTCFVSVDYNVCRKCVNNSYGSKLEGGTAPMSGCWLAAVSFINPLALELDI